jgi:hypothetical protein
LAARSIAGAGREKRLETSLMEVLSGLMTSEMTWSRRGWSFFFFFREGREAFKDEDRASRASGKRVVWTQRSLKQCSPPKLFRIAISLSKEGF